VTVVCKNLEIDSLGREDEKIKQELSRIYLKAGQLKEPSGIRSSGGFSFVK